MDIDDTHVQHIHTTPHAYLMHIPVLQLARATNHQRGLVLLIVCSNFRVLCRNGVCGVWCG
jgi:hypothetical protein